MRYAGGCVGDLERVMGIEPTYAAWKAAVLPLNYTRAATYLTGKILGASHQKSVAGAKTTRYTAPILRAGAQVRAL